MLSPIFLNERVGQFKLTLARLALLFWPAKLTVNWFASTIFNRIPQTVKRFSFKLAIPKNLENNYGRS
jgi:hypothetical protein